LDSETVSGNRLLFTGGFAYLPYSLEDEVQKIDALLAADTFETVMTKLEAFADQFERLATTPPQRELAVEFNAFVGEIIQVMLSPGEETEHRFATATETESLKMLHGHETLAGLFEEMRADEAAGMREDAHWYGKDALKALGGTTEAAATEKGKDHGIER
jgi:hypothetical protein